MCQHRRPVQNKEVHLQLLDADYLQGSHQEKDGVEHANPDNPSSVPAQNFTQ